MGWADSEHMINGGLYCTISVTLERLVDKQELIKLILDTASI